MASNPRRYVLEFYPTPAHWNEGQLEGPEHGAHYVSSAYAAKRLFRRLVEDRRRDGLVAWPRALAYLEESWDEATGRYTSPPVFQVVGGPDGGATCTKL